MSDPAATDLSPDDPATTAEGRGPAGGATDPDRPLPPARRRVPDKPSAVLDGVEATWGQHWEAEGTYRFDRSRPRDEVYSIDTPPPTVSGSLHVGHVFSYTHTDTIARFQRMRGREVFYPMGWDDNGLPTERRVQNYYGVACDPSLPYDADFTPPDKPHDPPVHISRRNFVELCHGLTATDEQAFEELWRSLGLSVDWSMTYATIDERCQRAAQRAFLRNLARDEAYQTEAPVLWDVDFQTAVAQAELEDRERPGAYHRIAFWRTDGDGRRVAPVHIETTRPELIAACVALVAHPDDERYRELFGTTVRTPLFDVEVPVHPHGLADPDKGSGIAMICTFGDTTDVTWWRELDLATRVILEPDGRIKGECPPWITTDAGQRAYAELAGRTVAKAQRTIVELLAASGDLDGEPRAITHPVKFFEKGDRPLEIVGSRQWYIRNGGRDDDVRAQLIERGRQLVWHPDYMRVRFENWVEGLNGDWLVSRQRFFGVPFPVWYAVDDDGRVDHDRLLVPDEAALPVDPTTDTPEGYEETQRDQPGGFTADPDVMDTWATSSLTPQIATLWEEDSDLHARTFPMDLRPQAHEIIRTWLFSTVLRAHLEHDSLPWRHTAISGWIVDPDRKKMSKSRGNVVTPLHLIEQYSADAVRYWAANGRPGTDTVFDEGQMKVGRRLAIKILNASKFALGLRAENAPGGGAAAGQGDDSGTPETEEAAAGGGAAGSQATGDAAGAAITEALDRSMLARLADLVDEATAAFEAYDYARVLERTEAFFWHFCDNHLELVKARAYGERGPAGAASAEAALQEALSTMLKLFAPFLPFVTEEVWSWWHDGSIHRSAWPDADALRAMAGDADPQVGTMAAHVLGEIRRAKTEAKRSLRTEVTQVVVSDTAERLAALDAARTDVIEAGRVLTLDTVVVDASSDASVTVALAPDPTENR
jgi:valyl-tRNA synthetase